MGMFTSIFHPETGDELQIKCGNDQCEVFHVGEFVGSYVNADWHGQGYLLDGVYDNWKNDYWVIIKKCRVAAVVAVKPEDDVSSVEAEWGIRETSPHNWNTKAHTRHEEIQKKHEDEQEKLSKTLEGKSNINQLAILMSNMIGKRLNYASIARSMFVVEPLPESGQEVIYEPPKKIKLEPVNKYDLIEEIIAIGLDNFSANRIEEVICQVMHKRLEDGQIGEFVVYAYPESDDIDLVISWLDCAVMEKYCSYDRAKRQLFQCKISLLKKGIEAVYQIMEV